MKFVEIMNAIAEAAVAPEEEKFVKVEPGLIKARYDYWNKRIFGGQLPDIPITVSKTKSYLGQTASQSMIRTGDASMPGFLRKSTIQPESIVIDISTNWKLTQRLLDAVLLHEMIHVLFFTENKIDVGHGPEFMAKRQQLSSQVGFKIAVSNEPDELPHLVNRQGIRVLAAVRTKKDGRKSVTLFVPQLGAEQVYRYMSDRVFNDDLKIYDTVTTMAYQLPVKRKLDTAQGKSFFIHPDQVAEIESGKEVGKPA